MGKGRVASIRSGGVRKRRSGVGGFVRKRETALLGDQRRTLRASLLPPPSLSPLPLRDMAFFWIGSTTIQKFSVLLLKFELNVPF